MHCLLCIFTVTLDMFSVFYLWVWWFLKWAWGRIDKRVLFCYRRAQLIISLIANIFILLCELVHNRLATLIYGSIAILRMCLSAQSIRKSRTETVIQMAFVLFNTMLRCTEITTGRFISTHYITEQYSVDGATALQTKCNYFVGLWTLYGSIKPSIYLLKSLKVYLFTSNAQNS